MTQKDRKTPPLTVLDVSRWQGRIDWDTVKASGRVHGVMLRALGSRNSTPYIDPMFETNYSACIRLGIPVGVYYYSCAVTAPQRDAELALLHDALRGKRLQLPAAIDVEDARLRALTPDVLSALVAGAARQLEHWGLYAMVYTYTHFADTALHMDTLAPFDLWLADYRGKRPARRHGMWQYTSRGRVPGISGPVDLSRTEKDYPALLHRAGRHLRRRRQPDLRGGCLRLLDRGGLSGFRRLLTIRKGSFTLARQKIFHILIAFPSYFSPTLGEGKLLFLTSGHFVQSWGRGLATGRLVSLGRAACAGLRPLFRFVPLGRILLLGGTAPAFCRLFLRFHFFILVGGFFHLISFNLRRRLGWNIPAHSRGNRLFRLAYRAGASCGLLYRFRDRGLRHSLSIPNSCLLYTSPSPRDA